jgi:hypothetical protein
MQKIPLQRRVRLLRIAVIETDLIIGACVIRQKIDVAQSRNCLLHNRLAVRGRRKIHGNETDLQTLRTEFFMQLLTYRHVRIHSNCDGAFLGAGSGDGRAGAFCTARHEHSFILELQIH